MEPRFDYPEGMHTPWELIIAMFAYAFAGWGVLFLIHRAVASRSRAPQSAREAARGYGASWNSSRTADF
jgi:hypothetical protein